MKIKIQKISSSILYAVLVVTLVILGMFFMGGEDTNRIIADPEMSQPLYTDPLIYWMYVLLGITIIVTVLAAIFQFATSFMDSPKDAVKSLLGLIAIIAVLIVSWAMGSGESLVMPAYDGTENVPFWLKITDMFLYSFYFLMGVAILLIFGFGIAKKFK